MREWLHKLRYKVRLLVKRRQLDRDLRDELAFHLAMKEESLKRGHEASPETAARIRFGNLGRIQEDCREVWIFGAFERFLADVRYAIRSLLKAPSFTIVAVVSLALGIGSTTGIFSLFNQTLLKALPVEDPSRLVNLGAPGPEPGDHSCGTAGDCDVLFSYPMFRDLERDQNVFTDIAAHVLFSANIAYRAETISAEGVLVSGRYFTVLGVKPALGRLLGPEDDSAPGKAPVAVLSHAYWKTHLAGNPAVLNDSIRVNGHALTIVGIAREGFAGTTFGPNPDVYVPITFSKQLNAGPYSFDDRRNYWIYLFARLKPGISIEQAREGINVPYHAVLNDVEAPLQTDLTPATLSLFKARRLTVDYGAAGQSVVRSRTRGPLTLLLVVTGLVLLIACANVANLLLARAAARASEIAIRVSIGAGRRRLVAQLLTEASILALIGGAAGLLAARWTLHFLFFVDNVSSPDPNLPVGLDANVLLFAVLVTTGAAILFGLLPALQSTRPDVVSSLKSLAGQPAGSRSAARFRSGFATFQMALSLVLLFAAGLFTKSLFNVSKVDLGLKVDKLIVFSVSPERNGYTPRQSTELFERLEEDIRKQEGVATVAAGRMPLLSRSSWGRSVLVEGYVPAAEEDIHAQYDEIGPGYFSTIGVPLIAGREFTSSDTEGAPQVAIVNQQFVNRFHLGPNPVGKRMSGDGPHSTLNLEIVGVVKDTKYSTVKDATPPVFFRPYRQVSAGSLNFYIRAVSDPDKALALVRPAVARMDPSLPVDSLLTMDEQVGKAVGSDRILGILSAAFASLATLLAAVGLYGVMAYLVARRTREFGLRLALGANPSQVQNLVLRQVAGLTALGGGVGILGALAVGHIAQSLLFQLKGSDPVILSASTAVLALIGLAAGFIPAYRASKVDPLRALHYE